MHQIPESPAFTELRAAFRAAVTAGGDGRPEYVEWRDSWAGYVSAVRSAKEAEQRHWNEQQRQFEHLWQEARRLDALSHKVGGRIDSADRGSFQYTAERHEADCAKWRADLATYTGRTVADDAPVTVEAVPFVPHLSLAYYTIDESVSPAPYSDELNAALNASVA